MRTSSNGVSLIKRFEGLELEAYQDIAGIWTIGYGHTGSDVQPGMRISEREAEALLKRDLRPREAAVNDLVRVPLNQNEFDALVSFVYNVGIGGFERSTSRRRLNRGDRVGAADALTWWNKATVNGVLRAVTGLTRRRAAERALFLTPTEPTLPTRPERVDDNSRITPMEEAPRRANPAESRTVQGATIAGGAGVASSTMGRDSAEELDQIETNIENGEGLTEDPSSDEGSSPPPSAIDPDDQAGEDNDGAPTADIDEDGNVVIDGGDGGETEGGVVAAPGDRPAKHEVHAVEAQVQLALMILIILAVVFVIYARIDDWFNYRR